MSNLQHDINKYFCAINMCLSLYCWHVIFINSGFDNKNICRVTVKCKHIKIHFTHLGFIIIYDCLISHVSHLGKAHTIFFALEKAHTNRSKIKPLSFLMRTILLCEYKPTQTCHLCLLPPIFSPRN